MGNEKNKEIIKIEKLSVIYFRGKSNEVKAIKDINLKIYPGEFVIFFGPSGCGKSTILYSIAGLEKNIEGKVYIEGDDLSQFSQKKLELFHQKKTGMIFQSFHLISSLSVLNNVSLPMVFMGKNKKNRNDKALELLNYFGVGDQADKSPTKLSGGQQQRVSICRALINDPSVLLADEPIGNLDSVSAEEVMTLLKDQNKSKKKTIILVTHNPAYLNYAHRVFYMKDGGIVETRVNRTIDDEADSIFPEFKTAISKDLELLAKSYSSIFSGEYGNMLFSFKAKQIVSEVLTGMTKEEIERIEEKISKLLIMGGGEEDEILKFLDDEERKGGMGMDKRIARNITKKIFNIVREIEILKKQDEKMQKEKIIDRVDEVENIRQYLTDTFNLYFDDIAMLKIFNMAIKDRIDNKINETIFKKILNSPRKKGGVGFDRRVAKKVTRRLELLILGKFKKYDY